MPTLPTLVQFTQLTAKIASEDGFEDYLPTYAVADGIHVIEGIPNDVDDRVAIQHVLGDLDDDEFMFGVLSGPGEITTGHVTGSSASFMQIYSGDGACTIRECGRPDWWQHGL